LCVSRVDQPHAGGARALRLDLQLALVRAHVDYPLPQQGNSSIRAFETTTSNARIQIDLFREKIPRSPIANFFPDYTGGSDLQAACDYFSSRFVGLNQSSAKQIYCHVTCATDTTQIKFVLSAVNDIGSSFFPLDYFSTGY